MPHGGGTASIFVCVSDRVVESVIDQLRTRAEKGKEKYGTTMERDDLSPLQWLQHLQEVALLHVSRQGGPHVNK